MADREAFALNVHTLLSCCSYWIIYYHKLALVPIFGDSIGDNYYPLSL